MRNDPVSSPVWDRPKTAAVAAVAATYLYFLLFAEFALLRLFETPNAKPDSLRQVMLILGGGGLAGSLIMGWRFKLETFHRTLRGAFFAAGCIGLLLLLARSAQVQRVAVLGVGLALGALTVVLASALRAVVGLRRLGLVIGAGTGLAYGLCNLPTLFAATPRVQTLVAVGAVLAAALTPRFLPLAARPPFNPANPTRSVTRWIGIFLVLVWFDSAAFYIIQHSPPLRLATWTGDQRLWFNLITHVAAAAAAGWAIDRGALRVVVTLGLFLLVAAGVMLESDIGDARIAAALYTFGVSCYSVALVYVPAARGRSTETGWLFAIAGWIGSALGIGMAQDLAHVPLSFIIAAGLVGAALLFGPSGRRRLSVAGFLLLCSHLAPTAQAYGTHFQIRRGREVYIAEGCIHCHSQYHRPGTSDVVRWGAERPLEATLAQNPPLIGNRRQGPDLARIGQRRTPEWNRLHLIAPRSITPRSRMPSYAHLFRRGDERGEALVAYLSTLGTHDDGGVRASAPPPAQADPRRLATAPALGHPPIQPQ